MVSHFKYTIVYFKEYFYIFKNNYIIIWGFLLWLDLMY